MICPPRGIDVALRKESVDRNVLVLLLASSPLLVALRKESVDRNFDKDTLTDDVSRSLSARRAWIEMDFSGTAWVQEFRRSPQGERG